MKLYHMSQTLKLGDTLKPNYDKSAALCQPFVQALERSEDCFYAMVLNGKYLYALLGKYHLREWSNYAKWATEGAFEFIRRTEYPDICSRLNCNYFYDNLEDSKKLFDYDWGTASEEERASVRLFEIDVCDEAPSRYDMNLYDEAYSAMSERQDVETVLRCSRMYFAGEHTSVPVWEILSDKPAVASKDLSELLK